MARMLVVVLAVAAWATGCGQEPPNEGEGAGSTEETTAETTTAPGSELRGVVDSYAVA